MEAYYYDHQRQHLGTRRHVLARLQTDSRDINTTSTRT